MLVHSAFGAKYRHMAGGTVFPPVQGQTVVRPVSDPFIQRNSPVLAADVTGTFDCMYWMWGNYAL